VDGPISGEAQRLFRRMGISGEIAAVLLILFGILIIVFPALIVWLVGAYLIVAGLITLAGHARGPRAGA
jgi:uncharacterized membrane protein HdeD (DUF308 family)